MPEQFQFSNGVPGDGYFIYVIETSHKMIYYVCLVRGEQYKFVTCAQFTVANGVVLFVDSQGIEYTVPINQFILPTDNQNVLLNYAILKHYRAREPFTDISGGNARAVLVLK